ncbi:MinD/ParA family protein [Nocardia jiangxiensis]|uniref:MinD/ParA family protein n=1 Tax=Nocardia jiangxiensis TaxID=282685 RepID=A0ABW6RVI6_9NOCA
MTTNDNSNSPAWLQGQGTDTATEQDDPKTAAAHEDAKADEDAVSADTGSEPGDHDSAPDQEQASGIFPPVPDSMDEQPPFPPGPQPGPDGQFAPEQNFGAEPHQFVPGPPFGQEQQGPFAPPGAPPQMGGFPPPQMQYGPPGAGQFPPDPGFPPPGNFSAPEHGGPFAPPGGPGEPTSFAPPNFGVPQQQPFPETPPHNFTEPPAPNYGEVRQETPYGEVRQEIGSDGMVRRTFDEEPQGPEQSPAGHDPAQFTQEPHSWAPPPPPQPQMYQPPQPQHPQPPQQQQPQNAGWQNGPLSQPNHPVQQQHQPPQQGFQPQPMPQLGQLGPGGQSVNDLNLLKRARRSPRGGWRRAVHKMSGGAINPGESSADVLLREMTERVNQPVRGDYRIAILSLKGGVGKTTTTVGLGSTFASVRGDRVIAIDANPDLGTLAHRVPRQTRSTVRNLLEDRRISRYSDVRAHTSQAPSRLEVLASEQDPAVSEAFSEADYRRAINILQQFYNIILTDCGTGLMHSAMSGVLDMASSLILVTSPAIDGARSASATLDWLEHHGYNKLVERTVVVVNASRRGASTVDLDQLRKLFLDRTRAVQVVPFDDHLAEGAEIDLELVSKPTRIALLELAAMVADDFAYNIPTPAFQPVQSHYPGPQNPPYPENPPYSGPQTGQYGIPDQYGRDPYGR